MLDLGGAAGLDINFFLLQFIVVFKNNCMDFIFWPDDNGKMLTFS